MSPLAPVFMYSSPYIHGRTVVLVYNMLDQSWMAVLRTRACEANVTLVQSELDLTPIITAPAKAEQRSTS
jgi:hypothetical protein